MATTSSAQVIIPEVYGNMAQAKFTGAVKVAGSPAVIEDNTLEGQPGETIHFPKWGALTELDDLAEATPMTTEQMATSESTATIKEAGKAVEITDRSRLVGLGDPVDEAARQFGVLAARKVDAALIAQAIADETAQGGGTPLSVTTTQTAFTWQAVVDGTALFGDELEPEDFAGIYINSAQRSEAFADPQFIDAAQFGADTPVLRGQLGSVGGMRVFVTDRITAGTFLVLKNQSLGLLYKQRPQVEQDRNILARTTIVTTTLHYAVKRLDDSGVAVVTLTAG